MKFFYLDIFFLGFFIFFFSCEEPDAPDSIWDGNDQGGTTPIVSGVEPSQGAFAAIDTIMITGQHFLQMYLQTLVILKASLEMWKEPHRV